MEEFGYTGSVVQGTSTDVMMPMGRGRKDMFRLAIYYYTLANTLYIQLVLFLKKLPKIIDINEKEILLYFVLFSPQCCVICPDFPVQCQKKMRSGDSTKQFSTIHCYPNCMLYWIK